MYQNLSKQEIFFWYFSVLTLTTKEQENFFLYFWVTLKTRTP